MSGLHPSAMARPAALLAALLILLAGCTTRPPRDLVWISVSGDRPCVIAADDRRFTLPIEGPQRSNLRRIARQAEGALVGEVDGATSFACWTAAVTVLRSVGFRRLGLVSGFADSDPAPAD